MKNIDDELKLLTRPQPRRELHGSFTTYVIQEITNHPSPKRWMTQLKEKFTMKFKKLGAVGVTIMAVCLLAGIGGVTYAVTHHFSLFELLNKQPVTTENGGHVTDAFMQKFYQAYVTDASSDTSKARADFEAHVTTELSHKLAMVKDSDPIVCAQNMPTSVSFESVTDSPGYFKAINHYATGDITIGLNYDNSAGIFTDITCPVQDSAAAVNKLQGYYTQYVRSLNDRSKAETAQSVFVTHTSAVLKNTITHFSYGYNPITCTQNIPAMVSFTGVSTTSMTAVLAFESGATNVTLAFDSRAQVFTAITCPPAPTH